MRSAGGGHWGPQSPADRATETGSSVRFNADPQNAAVRVRVNNGCATHQDVSTTQQGVTLSKMTVLLTVLFKIIFQKPSIHAGFSLFCDSGPFLAELFSPGWFKSYTWPGTRLSTKEQEQRLGWLALIRKIHVLMKPSQPTNYFCT